MAIQVTCPSCQTVLKTPETSAGKKAKCPKCGGIIQIPDLAPTPANDDEYVLEAEANPLAGFSDAELSAGASGGDRKPCPACGEMIMREAVKCRYCGEILDKSMKGVLRSPGNVGDPGWRSVRAGLSTLYHSIIIMLVAIIVLVVAFIAMGAGAMGGPQPDFPPVLVVVLVIGGLVILAAAIGAIVGQVRCAAVPEASGARGFAMGAAICVVANIALAMLGGATQSQGISAIGNLISMVGTILFILFIRRSAAYLGDNDLAASAGRYLIFGVAVFVGAIVFGVLAAMAQAGALLMVMGLALIVVAIVAFVWYLNLIKSLRNTIDMRTTAR